MIRILLLQCFLVLPLIGQTSQFKSSIAVFGGCNAFDAVSSYGKYEGNPVYGTKVDASALFLKAGIVGSVLLVEWLHLRKNPRVKSAYTKLNYIAGGAICGVGVHNLTVK